MGAVVGYWSLALGRTVIGRFRRPSHVVRETVLITSVSLQEEEFGDQRFLRLEFLRATLDVRRATVLVLRTTDDLRRTAVFLAADG